MGVKCRHPRFCAALGEKVERELSESECVVQLLATTTETQGFIPGSGTSSLVDEYIDPH